MSVMIVTSLGDIVVDLYTDRCPLTTKNFLKLCKMKYYNGCIFHTVEKDFMAQTGDRTGTGSGGDSVYRFLYGDQARFFDDEIHPDLKHTKVGTVAMASAGKNCNASQFYITLRDDIEYLDGKHAVFGIVEEKESLDTLIKINEAYVDSKGRPFKDIRVKHTYILDDPFDHPPQLAEFIPEKSPEGKPPEEVAEERLEDNWVPMDEKLSAEALEEVIQSKKSHTNAAILESIGDIPDAEIKPPDNVLFVCKLNPVTQDEDLYTIFSRFGTVSSADIIRDYKTGDSLCYAFIEFETKEACERAYFKMDNTLIDDRRIHVDFSQSVAKLWRQFRHGRGEAKDGCFKCGAPDHIARDCNNDGSDEKQQGLKYILKETNRQHGGDDQKSYDMLFDEENTEIAEHKHAKKVKSDYKFDHKSLNHCKHEDNRSKRHREDQKERSNRWGDTDHNERQTGGGEHHRRQIRGGEELRRSSGSRQDERDGTCSDRYKRGDDDHAKRERKTNNRRTDGRSYERSRPGEDYSYKEKRQHTDERR